MSEIREIWYDLKKGNFVICKINESNANLCRIIIPHPSLLVDIVLYFQVAHAFCVAAPISVNVLKIKVNPISNSIFFSWLPYGKFTSECLTPNPFLYPKGKVSNFQIQEMRAAQSKIQFFSPAKVSEVQRGRGRASKDFRTKSKV